MRDRVSARAAIDLARSTLKQPDALAYEMAQLRVGEGNWLAAADEWLLAVRGLPGYRGTALTSLTPAPVAARPGILTALRRDTTLDAQALAASLAAGWGDPEGAVRALIHVMPPRTPRAVDILTGFVGQLRGQLTRSAAMARGLAYEEIARRTVASASSVALTNAARAYQEAGDTDDARRVLALLSGTTSAGSTATETMIDVLVAAGRMDDAEAKLADADPKLTQDDRDRLRRAIAWGWARAGQLDRADARLQGDSTIEALALRGRIAIFRGDLKDGNELLRKAGPFVGSREDATRRTALLALLQPIQVDTLASLGAGLLALEQRDTARAASMIEQAAATLPAADGGAALYLLAGRLRQAGGDITAAERLLRSADVAAAPAVAPVAELELAQLLVSRNRHPEAQALLEHLILNYPGSAVVPEARRALDTVKGTVPSS
jgi:tetratricopeptide (TPR) repeat protein